MSGSVTVPGPNGTTITQTFSNAFNSSLATSIANELRGALDGGNLVIETTNGSAATPTVPGGKIGELVIEPGGSGIINVPASANYSFVVDNSLGPDTIFGSPGLSIIGGGGTHTIVDPAAITLGDTTSSSFNNISISGAGDNVAVGDGTNVLTGTGSGTMSGGTGVNRFIELGSYVVNSEGFDDTIVGGAGATTINASGPGASVVGGGGALLANLSGSGATLFGGGGATTVSVSGTTSDVLGGSGSLAGGLTAIVSGAFDTIVGGAGSTAVTLTASSSQAVVSDGVSGLSVLDSGTSDTINAGQGSTSVNAPGGSFVNGGSGPLNFVGGAGASTIVGGSGNATLFGGAGLTSLVGGAGGAVTFVNTTPGGLFYAAKSGNETIDASLSKGTNSIYGGTDSSGHNLLMGGVGKDYINAGAGADTMAGGGGANTFFFFEAAVGPSAHDVISDFSAIDNVMLVGYGPGAITGTSSAGGSTTITLSDNTKITFTGVTDPSALNGHIGQA